MKSTSINVQPIKSNSEKHNTRHEDYDLKYLRKDLSNTNSSHYFEDTSIHQKLAEIKARYKKAVGQSMQRKATPLREGVVVVQDTSPETMNNLKQLAHKIQEEWGIRCMQIHIHGDEGHYQNPETKEGWKPNLHAHMVFDWSDPENGKTIKLDKFAMMKMQDLTAEALKMKRGQTSDKRHLNALQFKLKAEMDKIEKTYQKSKERLQSLQNKIQEREKAIANFDRNASEYKVKRTFLGGLIKTNFVDKEKTEEKVNTALEANKRDLRRFEQEFGKLANDYSKLLEKSSNDASRLSELEENVENPQFLKNKLQEIQSEQIRISNLKQYQNYADRKDKNKGNSM